MQVVVLEDSPLIRHLIVELISVEKDITVVAALPSKTDIMQVVRQYAPDALIYAVAPGDGSHVEVVRQIKCLSPEARVIVLYNDPCPECKRRSLAVGAEACLDKTAEFDRILHILNHAPDPKGGPDHSGRGA